MTQLFFEVGAIVRHRFEPDWGLGQIQSIVGRRVTVTFENRGKVLFKTDDPPLDLVVPDRS